MIRVITGTAKNIKLKTPNIEGYRAVQEVAKGALFSIIGDDIKKSRCLDLYAGGGNLGIEALSRGALWCDFVDSNKISTKTIEENLKVCGFENKAEVFSKEAPKFVANAQAGYNYIFVDPFYHDTSHVFLMKNVEEILSKNGLVAFFHGKTLNIGKIIDKTALAIVDERRFGRSYLTIISH